MKSLILVFWAMMPAWAASTAISLEEEQRLQVQYSAYRGVDSDYVHAGKDALDRWMDWKWGLRIHWGLYCMFDGRESWIVPDHLQDKDWQRAYYASYQQFNPTGFDADEWMHIMQRAGMKYFSFTTKHHEGFCLWPTKTLQRGFRKTADGRYVDVVDHYSIAETPYKRDIVGDLVKAGRAHGLGVSLYYSHIDWHDWDFGWDERNFWYDPNFTLKSDPQRRAAFIQKERDQITELLTWYGPIDTLCLDISWPKQAQDDAFGVAKLVRRLQPQIMMDRVSGLTATTKRPNARFPKIPLTSDGPGRSSIQEAPISPLERMTPTNPVNGSWKASLISWPRAATSRSVSVPTPRADGRRK